MPETVPSQPPPPPKRRALVWLEHEQASLIRAVAEQADITVAWAGSPAGRGSAADVATALQAEPVHDLRRALATTDAELVLFAATESAGSPLDDPDLLRTLDERGVRLASMEPTPATTLDFSRFAVGERTRELVRFVPSTRRSRGFRAAAEVIESIGSPRTLTISQRSGAGQGSLFARLFDAMELVFSILGEPEAIDAANAGPVSASGVHLAPGESLRDLRGDMTANVRFGGARSASVSLSDSAGRWLRGATLVAQGGCLRMDDKSFEVIAPDGKTVDRSRSRVSSGSQDDPGAAAAIAEQVAQLLDPRAARLAPLAGAGHAAVLAMCEAALLSARTGQPESPGTFLRMAGAR